MKLLIESPKLNGTQIPDALIRRKFEHFEKLYDRIEDTRYFWESNLFDVVSKELIYSVQTESFEPASSDILAHEYGKLIVKDMVKSQVLNKKELVAKDGHNS